MAKATCSVDGCEGAILARGWCNRHYLRWRIHGSPTAGGPERAAAPPVCVVEGCDGKPEARGWCNKHYQRWVKYADPEYERQIPPCSISGCYRPAEKRGWCGMHYQRWAAHGDPTYERERDFGCLFPGCTGRHRASGFCAAHYQRLLRHGDPSIKLLPRGESVDDRFFMKVAAGPPPRCQPALGPCWIWIGGANRDGYGNFWDNGRCLKAHRWSFERFVGPIPDGLVIDHLCRVPACVNPHHLEPVTNGENVRRGDHWNARKTQCAKGHPFDEANTVMQGNKRRCRACLREKMKRRNQRIERDRELGAAPG